MISANALSTNARTKVLYISPVGERGGAETVLLNILKYQDLDVYEPVVGFLRTGPFVEEVQRLGVRTVVFPTTRFRNLLVTVQPIRSIRSFLRRERVGLVFGNMAMGHLYGGLAALRTQARTVWFLHGIPGRFWGVDLAAARVPAKMIFVFTEVVRRAGARLIPSGQIVLMPGGVDLTRFDPGTVPKGVLRQELGIESDGLVLACVARLQRWKGQLLFLQAAALVHASFTRTHFLLVGGTLFGLERQYAQQLRQEAARLLPERSVHFLGHRHDLPEILADVDVLVHCPITREPLGLAVLEAMAMHVPVVGTRTGAPEEIITDGETGALAPPGDPGALAKAILEVLSDPSKRKAMGDAGRRRVEERFSAERMVRQIEAAFQEVLADGN